MNYCFRLRPLRAPLLLACCSGLFLVWGQIQGVPGTAPSVVVNFKTLAKAPATQVPEEQVEIGPPQPGPRRTISPGANVVQNALPKQPKVPATQAPSPGSANFQALIDNNTTTPPDTMGAVGPNHVVTILNSQMLIQDRSGNAITTTPLNTFFAPITGGTFGSFDPRVTYDPYNSRWIVAADYAAANSHSAITVATSQTSDPTGAWTFAEVPVDGSGTYWADYPTLGFNKDWIVVCGNLYAISGGHSGGVKVWVFRKSDLYNSANPIHVTTITDPDPDIFTLAPATTYDTTLSTLYLLESVNGNFDGNGYLRLHTISGAVGSEILNATIPIFVSVPSTWSDCEVANCASSLYGFAPQLGSANLIDNGDDRMYSVVYRGGYIWAAQTVYLPAGGPTRSSVQWWQLAPTGAVAQFARIDDPTSHTFYAYPSLSVNKNFDVLIGYSRFSSTQYASSDYSFRFGSDPASTLQTDLVFKAGEASYFKEYSGTRNRWGDYSATVVDPVDDGNFWTLQEYAATPGGGFDRWGTWWAQIFAVSIPCNVTISTNLSGPTVSFDGFSFTGSKSFLVNCGSQHTIATTTPQFTPLQLYTFASWSDAGAISHTITAPASGGATYTANFAASFLSGIPMFSDGAGDLTPSAFNQYFGLLGVGTVPHDSMHVAFSDLTGGVTGYVVQNLGGSSLSYSGMLFYDQSGTLAQFQGFNNSTHEYRINNIASNGSINFMLSGVPQFQIRSDGDVNITGQVRNAGSLFLNNSGTQNLGLGLSALANNAGSNNAGLGSQALLNKTTGNSNVGIGSSAGGALTTGDSNIEIGSAGVAGDAATIRIGGTQTAAAIAGIRSNNITGAGQVVVNSSGQFGTAAISSRRFKINIRSMANASTGLFNLRPVTFHYKQQSGSSLEYGLIAEEVADIYPDVVLKDREGRIQTIQYEKLTPMVLNELQKYHADVAEKLSSQDETLRQQRAQSLELQKRIDALQELVHSKSVHASIDKQ